MADLGSMGYGRNMQSYIQMETWCTQLVRVIIGKIGFLLMLPGKFQNILYVCICSEEIPSYIFCATLWIEYWTVVLRLFGTPIAGKKYEDLNPLQN